MKVEGWEFLTVAELIALLQKFDPELPVVAVSMEGDGYSVTKAEVVTDFKDDLHGRQWRGQIWYPKAVELS